MKPEHTSAPAQNNPIVLGQKTRDSERSQAPRGPASCRFFTLGFAAHSSCLCYRRLGLVLLKLVLPSAPFGLVSAISCFSARALPLGFCSTIYLFRDFQSTTYLFPST